MFRNCMVTGVFDAGGDLGVLCQVNVAVAETSRLLVVPIGHLSFNRKDPIAREIAGCQKRWFGRRKPASATDRDNGAALSGA